MSLAELLSVQGRSPEADEIPADATLLVSAGIETVESAVNSATDAVKGQSGSLSAEAQKAGADLKNTAQKAGSDAQATFNKGKIDLEQAAKDLNAPKN